MLCHYEKIPSKSFWYREQSQVKYLFKFYYADKKTQTLPQLLGQLVVKAGFELLLPKFDLPKYSTVPSHISCDHFTEDI